MPLFIEATTVSDSYLMKKMDQNAGITSRILQAIKSGQVITENDIAEQIMQVRRTRISPLAEHVIAAFNRGEIVLIYSKTVKVVQAIPFIVAGKGASTKAYIFVNAYGTFTTPKRSSSAEKIFNIGMKDLYALMEGAYIALQYYRMPGVFIKNLGLMKTCMSVYTQMFLQILNKEYALSMSPLEYNQVAYCIARFFLENMWELQSKDLSSAYAFGAIVNANKLDYVQVQDDWDNATITNLEEFIEFLKEHFPRLQTMSVRFFTEYFMNTFRATVVLAMDVLPYFLFTVSSCLLGSFIANQPVIYEILKNTKGVSYFYSELGKII